MRLLFPLIFFIVQFAFVQISSAQQSPDFKIQTDFKEFTVRHVVFNSTFVDEKTAGIYKIKRSKYESLLNVSVNHLGKDGSMPAKLSGTVTNLMQQQKVLEFKEIKEKNATYYLAPIRIANEEMLHFKLQVTPHGSDTVLEAKFSQTVYADE